mmetsp:Transcript_12816/g.50049  ORF Transcript_12816/g.50049 Transcript_12816/m.50049 type:complete len:509 (-) Transcript_12816:79-1605(-)
MTSSLPSSVTSHPRDSYSRTSSSCGTLCGGPAHPAFGSYDTDTTSIRPPGANRAARELAYRSRSDGSTATRAPRSHTASIAGPPPDANRSASSRNDMLPCAPTLASRADDESAASSLATAEDDRVMIEPPSSSPRGITPNHPGLTSSSSGLGSGSGRIEKRSPSTMAMLPLVWTLLTPALHRSVTIASAGVVVRGKPARSKKSLAATPLRSTPYTLCPHAASHSMSTALPHSGTNTRLESSGGDVTPSPRSEFLCFMSARCVAGRWKPMRPSRQRSCQSFTAAACASASTGLTAPPRVPSSTIWEAPRDWGGGAMSAASGATAVFVTAGPVATDPGRDAKTRANPRVSKVPLASEMPAATPAAAPTATEAMTAELGQRVAPRESRCFRPSRFRGARGPIARGGSRTPLLSVASGANRRRRALPSACQSLTIVAAGPAGYRREPSARRPPRAAQSVPPPPVFSTSPDASGAWEPNEPPRVSRSSVAVAVGGRALDAPAAAVGKVGLVVL